MLNYTYLAKKRELETLNEDNIAEYRYIALFQTGTYADRLTGVEESILRAELTRFMREECLVVIASELDSIPDGSYLKTVFGLFGDALARLNGEAGICIGTVFDDVDTPVFTEPVCERIHWETVGDRRYPFARALSRILRKVRIRLTDASLDQFPLHPLPSRAKSLQFANGQLIETRIDERSVVLRDNNTVTDPESGETYDAHRQTIAKARDGDLVLPYTLKYLSLLLDEPEQNLKLMRVVPNKGAVLAARQLLGRHAEKGVREWFGPFSDFFFDHLEWVEDIPARHMKFIYHHYKKLYAGNKSKTSPCWKNAPEPLELIDRKLSCKISSGD